MEDWREKLTEDNANCKWMAEQMNNVVEGTSVDMKTVHTNMFNFALDPEICGIGMERDGGRKYLDHNEMCKILKEEYDVLCMASFQNDMIRVVTHRDANRQDLEYVRDSIDTII